jgi:hypothetical protein
MDKVLVNLEKGISLREISSMVFFMEKVNSFGLMELNTRESLETMK